LGAALLEPITIAPLFTVTLSISGFGRLERSIEVAFAPAELPAWLFADA
jgi:hypothetical protein